MLINRMQMLGRTPENSSNLFVKSRALETPPVRNSCIIATVGYHWSNGSGEVVQRKFMHRKIQHNLLHHVVYNQF